MKVLVIGATGFIGLPISQALVRAGHVVYGQTRSAEKAKQLTAEEIIPVIGPTNEPQAWLGEPFVASLDAIINTAGGYEVQTIYPLLFAAVEEAAQKFRHPYSPKLAYIATSGVWPFGHSLTNIVTESTPTTNAPEAVSWLPELDQRITHSQIVNGVVIRPGLFYGRSSSELGRLFRRAYDGKVAWFGNPRARWSLIHCDDLADLYLRATERAASVKGNIFVGTNGIAENLDDILNRLVEVSGAQGPHEYVKPTNPFEVAWATSQIIRPTLARALLDWQPRKPGLVDGLEVYYSAWKASAGL